MTPEDQSRSDFEAHMLSLNACTRLHRQSVAVGGYYRTVTVQRAWDLWQASRRTYRASALEEAAAICDEHAAQRYDSHEAMAIINCADAIRELAEKTKEG